jgi:predicted transcriptional regulator
MAGKGVVENLSRRERQIMNVVYRLGRATATEVMEGLPSPPGNATVRKLLRILEEKGHLRHRREGNRYVYFPIVSTEKAKASAMKHLLDTFFKGSAAGAVVALLDMAEKGLSDGESEAILELIERSKKEGR